MAKGRLSVGCGTSGVVWGEKVAGGGVAGAGGDEVVTTDNCMPGELRNSLDRLLVRPAALEYNCQLWG